MSYGRPCLLLGLAYSNRGRPGLGMGVFSNMV